MRSWCRPPSNRGSAEHQCLRPAFYSEFPPRPGRGRRESNFPVTPQAIRTRLAYTGELFIENQYHNRECDCNERGNNRDQDGVRGGINSADTSQDTIDEGKNCPSSSVSTLLRGRLSRLRRGRNRNGIVHDDPFDQGAPECRANISLIGREAMRQMLACQISSSKSL